MTENEPKTVSRRQVTTGIAWSTPVVVAAVAAPMATASPVTGGTGQAPETGDEVGTGTGTVTGGATSQSLAAVSTCFLTRGGAKPTGTFFLDGISTVVRLNAGSEDLTFFSGRLDYLALEEWPSMASEVSTEMSTDGRSWSPLGYGDKITGSVMIRLYADMRLDDRNASSPIGPDLSKVIIQLGLEDPEGAFFQKELEIPTSVKDSTLCSAGQAPAQKSCDPAVIAPQWIDALSPAPIDSPDASGTLMYDQRSNSLVLQVDNNTSSQKGSTFDYALLVETFDRQRLSVSTENPDYSTAVLGYCGFRGSILVGEPASLSMDLSKLGIELGQIKSVSVGKSSYPPAGDPEEGCYRAVRTVDVYSRQVDLNTCSLSTGS